MNLAEHYLNHRTRDAAIDTALAALPLGVLGYQVVTSNHSGLTSDTNISGLSVTVDIPADRVIRVTGHAQLASAGIGNDASVNIMESSTALGRVLRFDNATNYTRQVGEGSAILTPSAGSHTYHLRLEVHALATGSIASEASSTNPAFILVEDLGPV